MTAKSLFVHVPIMLVLVFSVVLGIAGIDFGHHWDEIRIIDSISGSIRSGTILPGWYNYPSLSYCLALACITPEAISAVGEARKVIDTEVDKSAKKEHLNGIAQDLADISTGTDFTLRVRTLFSIITLLSVVWVYLFVFRWRRSWPEALLAGGLLALSWEVHYHSRWIAPDGVLMQFVALSILTLFLASTGGRRRWMWIVVSTLVAGLACGTKYTGGLLIVPVLIVSFRAARESGRSTRAIMGQVILPLMLLFCAIFFITTPGAALQPFRFSYDVLNEMRHYRTGHGEHTIAPGSVHAARMISYLSLSAFSRYWPLALLVFLGGVGGTAYCIRRDRGMMVILLLVPAVYFLYMCTQRVMIVRNLLLLMPYLAILGARGLVSAAGSIPVRAGQVALGTACALMIVVNGAWLFSATQSIINRDSIDHGRSMSKYLAAHPDDTFFFSRGAYEALAPGERDRENVTKTADEAERFMIMTTDLGVWYGNRFSVFEIVSGPFEVNLDYYPSWKGDPRVFVVDRETAEKIWYEPPVTSSIDSTKN